MERKCGILPGSKVLAAVSGGADSAVLLFLLVHAGYEVVVGHLDHGLRDSSQAEQQAVSSEAKKYGVTIFTERVDTRGYSEEKKLSIEEAARELRYEFLFRIAEETGCEAVVTGQHADDQAETILMHIIRGSGLNGLAGMLYAGLTRWHPEIKLVRPLLEFTREELEEICTENQLVTIDDQSNEDTRFLRNRVRHQVLPGLREINPQIDGALRRLGEITRGDLELLDGLVEEIWNDIRIASSESFVKLTKTGFIDQPRGLQRRLIRKAIDELIPGLQNIGHEIVEGAIDAVTNPSESGLADLAQGIRLKVDQDDFSFKFWDMKEDLSGFPQLSLVDEVVLAGPGTCSLGSGWEIEVLVSEKGRREPVNENQDPFIAFLDPGEGPVLFLVRRRREGDRISPLGMEGRSIKVSDLMINERIPQPARENWPVVELDGEIVWVPGYRISEGAKIKPETLRIVIMQAKRTR